MSVSDVPNVIFQWTMYAYFVLQLKTTKARVVSVPSDRQGMRPDLLRDALKKSSDGRRKVWSIRNW